MSLFSTLADWLVPGRRRRENERFQRIVERMYTAEDLAPIRDMAEKVGENPQEALDRAWAEAGTMDAAERLRYVREQGHEYAQRAAGAYLRGLGPTEHDWEPVVADAELAVGQAILRSENRAVAYADRPTVKADPAGMNCAPVVAAMTDRPGQRPARAALLSGRTPANTARPK